ncbi:MAG: hypothetical protein WAW69_18680 [Polaromonas sp.]
MDWIFLGCFLLRPWFAVREKQEDPAGLKLLMMSSLWSITF